MIRREDFPTTEAFLAALDAHHLAALDRAAARLDVEHEAYVAAEKAGERWLDDLKDLATQAADAEGAAAAAREVRDDAIRDALAAGVRPVDIVRATGLDRSRVYQIKDGTR